MAEASIARRVNTLFMIEERSEPEKIVVRGGQTRVVWKAVNDNRKEAVRDIEAAMARAVNAFNRKVVK